MLQLNINKEDISVLNYEKFHYPCPIVQKRMHAIYLKYKGLSNSDIADICCIHMNSVTNYIKMYNEGGIETLKQLNYGTDKSVLKKNNNLVEYLHLHPVHTVNQAIEYIKEATGITRSYTSVRKFLHNIGLKPRKTGHIPAKADFNKQKDFLENEINPLIEKAKKNECVVLFLDASHFVYGVFLTMLWSVSRLFIASPSGRQRLNVLGALNPITLKISYYCNTSYINAQTIEIFFKQLKEEYIDKPIYIFLDNARYQHCKYIEEVAESLGINLKFLPTYSPNLNLIERLWKFIKKEVLNGKYYDCHKNFQKAIYKCLEDCKSKHKSKLKSLLTLNFQLFENSQIYVA